MTSNETTLVQKGNVMIPEQVKKPVSILGNKFCEDQAFPYVPHIDKFGYNALPDTPINPDWCFNQPLLNFNQYFESALHEKCPNPEFFLVHIFLYLENLHIQSKYRKIQTRSNSLFGHFSRSADPNLYFYLGICMSSSTYIHQ